MKTKISTSRSYSTTQVTDGLITQGENCFDATKPMTEADLAAFKAMLSAATPGERVRRRLAQLDALKDITPAIQLRIDAIRKVYGRLGRTEHKSREELDLLREADRHRRDILLLRDLVPKAVLGDKSTKGRKVGTVSPIREVITHVLKRHLPRNLRNLALFDEVAKWLPRGWHATESPKRLIGPGKGKGHGLATLSHRGG
jgi:hypothetical protein